MVLGILAAAVAVLLLTGSFARTSNQLKVADAPLGPAVLSWPSINPSAVSTSWYCPLAPASEAGGAERVIVINPSRFREQFQIGSLVGKTMRRYRIAPYSSIGFSTPTSGGVSVLSKGSVVAEVASLGGSDLAPCTSSPAVSWLAGGLGTRLGEVATVQVYNPFSEQAIVDVAGLTTTGTVSVPKGQGIIIPSGGTVALKADTIVPGEDGAALSISAKAGRVVVSELVGRSSAGSPTYEPAVAAPSVRSNFLYIPTAGLSSLRIDLANPTAATEQVSLGVRGYRQGSPHEAVLQRSRFSLRVVVPAGSTVGVDLTAQATQGSALAVSVTLDSSQGVYAWASIERRSGGVTAYSSELPQVLRSRNWVIQCNSPDTALLPLGFSSGLRGGPVNVQQVTRSHLPRAQVTTTSLVAPGVISVPSQPSGLSFYHISAPAQVFVTPAGVSSCLSLPVAGD